MNAQTEPTEAAESQEDGLTNAGADKGKDQQQAGATRLGSPSTPSLRPSESHAKKRKKSGAVEAAGGSDHPVQNSNEESHGMVKRDRGDTRKSGQKKKSTERKEAKQDEREARAVMTTGPDSDATPHDVGGGVAEDGKACHDGTSDDALHPPTPWPGRFLHGQNSSGAVKTATTAGKKYSVDGSSASEDKHKKKEKRAEKDGAASPETKPHDPQGSPSLSPDKRRRDEKQRGKEDSRRESKVEACDQQRRASSELLRGPKEKGRAFWNKQRTPRRGILSRSLSAESLARTSTKCASLDDEALIKRKKHKKHKRKGLQDEGVKFDKVVVRHYPREVCIGGCMLDPNQGPFLGIGWDWKQEEVHNLYSFERLRESSDRTHVAHAIPSTTRHALLVQYGLKEDEIQEMILEMRRKDKELLRGGAASSILPSFWPWKRAG